MKKYGGSLDASDTGTGKSTTFLAVCKAVGATPAIVTRKAVIDGWLSECDAMEIKPLFVTNYEQAKTENFPFGKATVDRKTIPNGSVMTKNRYEWGVTGRVLFCFDEVQNCRGRATMNSQMLLSAAAKYKTCMASATPFTSPMDAFAIGRTLRLFSGDGYFSWMLSHGVRKNGFGHMEFCHGQRTPAMIAEGLKHMAKIHGAIFPERGVRTTRWDIPDFPDEITTTMAVEPRDLGETQAIYQRLIDLARTEDLKRALEGVPEDLHDVVEPLAVTQGLRLRQEAELQKCGAIIDLANDAVCKGESVAIFLNFDHTIKLLAKEFKTRCIVRGERRGLDAEVSFKDENNYDRTAAVREFQANREPIILVNCAAGGAGISLHDPITQRPRTSLISTPWSAIVLKQVLGRTLRLGGGFSTRKLLFAKGTIEDRVMARVSTMTNNLDTLTDGDLSCFRNNVTE